MADWVSMAVTRQRGSKKLRTSFMDGPWQFLATQPSVMPCLKPLTKAMPQEPPMEPDTTRSATSAELRTRASDANV